MFGALSASPKRTLAQPPGKHACGWWQCGACGVRKARGEFSAWRQHHRWKEAGTQMCNGCKALQFVCRFAARTNQRLARLRARAGQEQLRRFLVPGHGVDTDVVERRVTCPAPHQQNTTRAVTPTTPRDRTEVHDAATYVYARPLCDRPCHSLTRTGQVHHRKQCGNFFRVADGVVAGRVHSHKCPKCGAVVQSSKACGSIHVLHKTATGRACARQKWTVKPA